MLLDDRTASLDVVPMRTGDDRRTDLAANPIDPAHVLEGAPEARAMVLSTSGDGLTSGLWDCTAGRFRWYFGSDEIVHIIEGEVLVEDQTGGVVTLRPGDVAHFASGTVTTWTVPDYVKKFYVDRVLPGDPLSRAVRRLRRLVGRLRGR